MNGPERYIFAPPPQALASWRSMKVTQPHSEPDGESSSLGMKVSTTAVRNAASSEVKTSLASDSGAGPFVVEACCSGLHALTPVATAAPAAPTAPAAFKKSRRGSLVSAMVPSQSDHGCWPG